VLADRSTVQIEVARQKAALLAARALLYGSVEDMHRALTDGIAVSPRQIAVNRAAAALAVESGAAVTAAANVMAGGSAIYASSDLQRHARDAEVMLHHFTVSPHTWEEVGRVLLGRQPNVPAF
jgi:alkylation response protein AidB-like acyl-CoA dehydrogenase